jgi:hypothetical protein
MTLAKAKDRAHKTFIVQASLTVITYDGQNIYIGQTTCCSANYDLKKFYSADPCLLFPTKKCKICRKIIVEIGRQLSSALDKRKNIFAFVL